ncbi:MAG: AAA family ATPase, partial [Thermoleophilia bacterium]|nr:AAA family ATPase [Thermoleophilia bacterium]
AIDPASHDAWVGTRRLSLTGREFELLHHLAEHAGWVFSREQLIQQVWGYEYVGDTRLVSVHMSNIRKKLGTTPTQPEFIENVRGVGYRLVKPGRAPGLAPLSGEARKAGATSQGAGLIGREAELRNLVEAFEAAADSHGSFVLLTGDAGIGKTSLAGALADTAAERGALVCSAHCHEVAASTSYRPWAQILRGLLGALSADDLRRFLGPGASRLAALVPEVGRCVDGDSGDDAGPPLFDAISGLLGRIAAERVVVLVFEDLEWCDPDSLPVFQILLDEVGRLRLFVVITMEDTEKVRHRLLRDTLAVFAQGGARRMHLQGLTSQETEELVANVAGEKLPRSVSEAIYNQSEGNPLFAGELARLLVTDEELAHGLRTIPGNLPLSPQIRDIVERRVARVSPECRTLLEAAAVAGRTFSVRLLQTVTGSDMDSLLASLDEALQGRLIEGDGDPGRFRFAHPLIRQVLADDLGGVRRLALHSKMANALEDSGESEERIPEIAYHYAQSAALGDAAKALDYARRAGESAMAQWGFEDAAGQFGRAVDLLPLVDLDGESRRETAIGLRESAGDALLLGAHPLEAVASYQQALLLLPAGSERVKARMHRKTGNAWQADQRPDAALECFDVAEHALSTPPEKRDSGTWQEWIEIQLGRMDAFYFKADLPRLAAAVEVTEGAVLRSGTKEQQTRLAALRLSLSFRLERYVISPDTVEEAREQWLQSQEGGSRRQRCNAEFVLAFALLWNGRVAEAGSHLLSCEEAAQSLHDRRLQVLASTYLAVAARVKGDVKETEDWALISIERAAATHLPGYVATAKADLAWVALRRGDSVQAERLAREALALWETPFAYPFEWLARWPLVAVLLERDDLPAAMEQAEALLLDHQQPPPPPLASSLALAAEAWQIGDAGEAKSRLVGALAAGRDGWDVAGAAAASDVSGIVGPV